MLKTITAMDLMDSLDNQTKDVLNDNLDRFCLYAELLGILTAKIEQMKEKL